MKLSDIHPFPAYFGRYMELSDDVSYLDTFSAAGNDIRTIPLDLWKKVGDTVYAPGKWTIKSIIQHVIDTERIFMYRALCYARGEKEKVLPFDENAYADNAPVDHRTIENLLAELSHTHESAGYLFSSFPEKVLSNPCHGFAGDYMVGAVPFILLGHQRWHFRVIEERYLPLLSQ